MQIEYSFSRWNGLTTKKPYHKAPTLDEIENIIKSEKNFSRRADGVAVIIDDKRTFCEVRAKIGDSIAHNTYSDCYSLTA